MSAIDNLTKVAVLLASLTVIGQGGLSVVRDTFASPKHGENLLTYQSSATAERAEVTLTNLKNFTVYACIQGRVTSKAGTKVDSAVVCTGDMKPHTSVHLLAPFQVGAVLGICNRRIGETKVVDWTDCSFDVIDKTTMAERLSAADVCVRNLISHSGRVRATHSRAPRITSDRVSFGHPRPRFNSSV